YIYGGIVLFNNVDASTIRGVLDIANEFGLEELVDVAQTQLAENNDNRSWILRKFAKVYKKCFVK
ncbi:8944_t:CDS:1, partial [Cetraspora pellucida]